MIRIAHRGNYKGKNASRENRIDYLHEALDAGFNIEVDVRYSKNQFWLGHDDKQEKIDISFLENPLVWTHSKNLDALCRLWHNPLVQTFWHDLDEFTYTSMGVKWANAQLHKTSDGIMVMPDSDSSLCAELRRGDLIPLGICSDDFNLFS